MTVYKLFPRLLQSKRNCCEYFGNGSSDPCLRAVVSEFIRTELVTGSYCLTSYFKPFLELKKFNQIDVVVHTFYVYNRCEELHNNIELNWKLI